MYKRQTTLDGKPVAEAVGKPVGFLEGRDGQWMKVEDDQFLPGFASALEGLKAGDSKDITVTIPDTFPITELDDEREHRLDQMEAGDESEPGGLKEVKVYIWLLYTSRCV